MRIVLVGAPDSGKNDFWVKELSNYIKLYPSAPVEDLMVDFFPKSSAHRPAIGPLTDYRTELLLASYRANEMVLQDNRIFTHSPLDNIAYAMTIVAFQVENETVSSQWIGCFDFFPILFQDSWKSDLTIYLPYEGDDIFYQKVDENLKFLLKNYGIVYVESKDTENIHKKIERFLDNE